MYTYRVLTKKDLDNMGLVPYDFDPEFLAEEYNSRQYLIIEPTVQQSTLLYDSSLFGFSSKIICVKHVVIPDLCSPSAILEYVLLTSVTW